MNNTAEQLESREAYLGKSWLKVSVLRVVGALLLATQFASSKDFLWVQQAGGTTGGAIFRVAVDGAGNCYAGGYFVNTATFGDTVVTGSGGADVFLAKYENNGNLLWLRTAGGRSHDYCYGVAIDGNGNCYLTGSFQETAVFGNALITAAGAPDVFVAKYDSAGNFQWVRQAGGSYKDQGSGISVSQSGDVFVAGTFAGSATFGTTTLTNNGAVGIEDIFLAKYDTDGNLSWVRKAGGDGSDFANGVVVDKAGNCFVTGSIYSSLAAFDSQTLTNLYDNKSAFLAKYDSSGGIRWVTEAATVAGNSQGISVAVDGTGNPYMAGYLQGSVNFGTVTLTNSGNYFDSFVAKYGSNGGLLWARPVRGTDTVGCNDLAVDGTGLYTLVGSFNGTAIFGGRALTSKVNSDGFAAQFDGVGNLLWVIQTGGTGDTDWVNAIALDIEGNCFVAGNFSGTSSFGSTTLTNSGGKGMFLGKLGVASPPTPLSLAAYICAALRIDGTAGSKVRVEYLSDLSNTNSWTVWTNFTLSSSSQVIVDLTSTNAARRFYRAVSSP